jgi:hypothetical protein
MQPDIGGWYKKRYEIGRTDARWLKWLQKKRIWKAVFCISRNEIKTGVSTRYHLYIYGLYRHWLHKQDVSKADYIRLQVQ